MLLAAVQWQGLLAPLATVHSEFWPNMLGASLMGSISVLLFALNSELVGVPIVFGLLSLIALSGDPGEVFPYVLAEVATGALTGYVARLLVRAVHNGRGWPGAAPRPAGTLWTAAEERGYRAPRDAVRCLNVDPRWGALWETRSGNVVEVIDATTGEHHCLRVDSSWRTAHQAVASTFGMTANEYNPIEEA